MFLDVGSMVYDVLLQWISDGWEWTRCWRIRNGTW